MSKANGAETVSEAMADAAAVFTVLAFRLPMLALAPTPARRREAERMVTEKAEAAMRGAVAAQAYWWRAAMTPWAAPADLWGGAYDAFAAPGRRTLRANARRLARRRTI